MMAGISNFREMGGLPTADGRIVRSGVVFRSGHLAGATDDDLTLLTKLGVATVLDVRTDADIVADGLDRLHDGCRYSRAPVGDVGDTPDAASFRTVLTTGSAQQIAEKFGDGKSEALLCAAQRRFVEDAPAVEAARSFLEMASSPGHLGVLLHCSAGKDRTGWLCSVLACALGVTREAIEAHYLESNDANRVQAMLQMVLNGRDVDPEHIRPILEVRTSYLDAAFGFAEEIHGSIDAYLSSLGADATYRRKLQSLLLVDA